MGLSTAPKSLAIIGFCLLTMQGCASCGRTAKPVPQANVSPPQNTRMPFATKEPATLQGDMVVTTAGSETHTFPARKGDKRRIDIDKRVTEILAGSRFVIDHAKKIYYEEPPTGTGPNGFVSPAASFFVGAE